MRSPGSIWIWITAALFLPALGWADSIGAKAIFTTGEGPTIVAETPDSTVPLRRPSQSTSPKTTAAKQTESQRERYMGFAYWAELDNGNGEYKRLTTDRAFRRGDRVRLTITSNWDGHLYVVNLSSAGHSQVLFPHPTVSAGNSFVEAHTRFEIPTDTHLEFDDTPGEATVLVMLSPTPLSGIVPSPSAEGQVLSREDITRLAVLAYLKGTKDMLLEVDTSDSQPASYVVAPLSMLERSGELIALQVKLKHE